MVMGPKPPFRLAVWHMMGVGVGALLGAILDSVGPDVRTCHFMCRLTVPPWCRRRRGLTGWRQGQLGRYAWRGVQHRHFRRHARRAWLGGWRDARAVRSLGRCVGHRVDGLQHRGALGSPRLQFHPFNEDRMFLSALPIYTLSFIGSSATFGLILEFTTWYIWFITAINTGRGASRSGC